MNFIVLATGQGPLSYQWQLNTVPILGATNTSYTIANVQAPHAGTYCVVVSDTAGRVTSSNAILTVNRAPSVGISSPANGATFTAPVNITLIATASDSDGSVNRVEFFHGTTNLHEATTAPYTYTWPNVAAGNYSFTARATDNQGATTTSMPVTVTVASQIRYTLSLTVSPSGAGAISANPEPSSDGKYASGTVVALIANPTVNFRFVSWGGDASGTANSTTVTMNGDRNIRANFTDLGPGSVGSTPIIIRDNTSSLPYPSVITVSAINGVVSKITVNLAKLSHTYTRDIGILLVGPKGQKVVLMRNAGGKIAGVTDATLIFTDSAPGGLPSNAQIASGSFKPSDYAVGLNFPPPAPGAPYSSSLNVFSGIDANGAWSLFVVDTESEDVGTIAGGWSLSFSTEGANTAPTISKVENQTALRNTSTSSILFTVADQETAVGALTVAAVSSNKTLVPDSNLDVSGSGSNRTIVITPAADQIGTTTITLTVTDGGGMKASTSFTLTVNAPPTTQVRGDFDGDGRPDIVFQDANGFLQAWFMNGAERLAVGSFDPNRVSDVSFRVVASGDFNGDGRADLVLQSMDETVAVWFMDGTRLTSGTLLNPSKPRPGWGNAAQWTCYRYRISTGKDTGQTLWAASWLSESVVAVPDLNGDGKPDLIFQETVQYPSIEERSTLYDWYCALVDSPRTTTGVWILDGLNMRSESQVTPSLPDGWRVVGAGDFNADGKTDLVLQNSADDGGLAVWYLDGIGRTANAVFNPPNPGSGWRVASTLDRNGDGKPDLLFQHTNLDLAVWFMDGTKLNSAVFLTPRNSGGTWKVVAP